MWLRLCWVPLCLFLKSPPTVLIGHCRYLSAPRGRERGLLPQVKHFTSSSAIEWGFSTSSPLPLINTFIKSPIYFFQLQLTFNMILNEFPDSMVGRRLYNLRSDLPHWSGPLLARFVAAAALSTVPSLLCSVDFEGPSASVRG